MARTFSTSGALRILSICAATLLPVASAVIPAAFITDPAYAQSDRQLAQAANQVLTLRNSGNCPQAIDLGNRLIEPMQARLGETNGSFAWLLYQIGSCYVLTEMPEQAEPLMLRALDIRQRILPPAHVDITDTIRNLGTLYFNLKQFDKAETFYKRALATRE